MTWQIIRGDCVERMRELDECSVDAVVCDPPYGLEFMGKDWDRLDGPAGAVIRDPATERGGFQDGNGGNPYSRSRIEYGRDPVKQQEWHLAWCVEALRVLKPGGHLLAFGGTRTYHRLACAVEDAGFEIRDTICWLYGSGFPKSLDVSKAIDRAAGAERDVVGTREDGVGNTEASLHKQEGFAASRETVFDITAPATPEAQQWEGWGTALKPAHEPVVVARKPLAGTVAQNVLEHGTGALNVDGCRIGFASAGEVVGYHGWESRGEGPPGRWPPNVVLDDEAARMLDEQTGELVSGKMLPTHTTAGVDGRNAYGKDRAGGFTTMETYGDSGGASRFFYVAKASRAERNAGVVQCSCKTFTEWVNEDPSPRIPADSATPPPRATTERTLEDDSEWSTTGSGSRSADQSPRDTTSTTSTGTSRTTDSRTSGSSTESPTSGSTHHITASATTGPGSDAATSAGSGSQPTPSTSTSPARAGSPTDDADPATSESSSEQSSAGGLWCPSCGGLRGGHPTVKPIDLMRWLVRLATPPGGTVLDPFAGSGTTGCATVLEGFDFIGIEREPEYADIAEARIRWWHRHRGDGEAHRVLAAAKVRERVELTGQASFFDEEDEAA